MRKDEGGSGKEQTLRVRLDIDALPDEFPGVAVILDPFFVKKADRIEAFVARLAADATLALDACYQGYFRCFNAREYYEAHDVLEHLWLEDGPGGPNYAFYKGLIQVAGAFVHLRKQFEHPSHAKHGRRLAPAARLFEMARANLAPYEPRHLLLDVAAVRALCAEKRDALAASGFTRNPWSPELAPTLALQPA